MRVASLRTWFSSLKTRTKVLAGVVLPLVLLVVLSAVSFYSISSIRQTSKWVDHTRVVLAEAAAIVASAVDMETGMRGYLLAGRDSFLGPYVEGEKATYQKIADLQQTVSDNPAQVERLKQVEEVLRQWQSNVTEEQIELRRQIGDAETMNDMAALVGKAEGKVYFDKFRGQVETFAQREATLLKQRRAEFTAARTALANNLALVQESAEQLDRTNQMLRTINGLLTSAVEMETGMRGYLLAGEEELLAPYESGKDRFSAQIETLRELAAGDPAVLEQLETVENVMREWDTRVAEPAILLRANVNAGRGTFADIERLVRRRLGQGHFARLREIIAAMRAAGDDLLREKRAAATTAGTAIAADLDTMRESEWSVSRAYAILGKAKDVLAAAIDMETGMRGYLLAGKDDYLTPYRGGGARFSRLSTELARTVADRPDQTALLGEMQTTIADWKDKVAEKQIALRRQIGDARTMDDMADIVAEGRGQQYFDKFRQLMADFSAEEAALMEVREEANRTTTATTFATLGLGTAVALAIGLLMAWLIGGAIAGPLGALTGTMRRLADGETELEVDGTGRGDEIGEMARATEVFRDNAVERLRLEAEARKDDEARHARQARIDELIARFREQGTAILSSVSANMAQMQGTAASMNKTAEDASGRAASAAAASEEASTNVQTVAASAEELAASIQEIGRQVQKSSDVIGKATETSQTTSDNIMGLANAAQKIGDVVSMISDIAEQTNLLALNATIEAARAGESGKGFAVVASEVKQLAEETAKATGEIGQQISGIQSATQGAVEAIQQITAIMDEVSSYATGIASAVEQQNAATAEISRNVQEAAAGTESVSADMGALTSSVGEASKAADEVQSSSSEAMTRTRELESTIDTFLSEVAAA